MWQMEPPTEQTHTVIAMAGQDFSPATGTATTDAEDRMHEMMEDPFSME